MNKFDLSLYKSLKFFADNTRQEVNEIIEIDKEKYDQSVPEHISRYLTDESYIRAQGNTYYIITKEGITQLRELERIFNRRYNVKNTFKNAF